MKTRFPLFARLLLWCIINVALVLIALFLTIRFQFAAQFRGFLPDTSRPQTQAMAEVLIHELTATPKEKWDQLLAVTGTAYHMQFALYGKGGVRVAGPELALPPDAAAVIRMTVGQGPPPGGDPRSGGGGLPPGFFPGGPGAGGGPGGPGAHTRILPDFPQRVIRTDFPENFWLMVHLPMDRLQIEGLQPMMLVGNTNRPTETPLLFNPNPWLYLAAGTIVFSSIYWLLLTRNLTQAIARMTSATEEIAEGRFDVHASETRTDELGRLGLAINRMSARLKGFVTGQRRFLGDVAHELCSPLARMEVALSILEERVADAKAQSYVTDVREEVTHMRKLAHELLSFSKASLAGPHIGLRPISVADIVAEAVRQEHCDDGQVRVAIPPNLQVSAQPDLLCRALSNLLRNAIRYAGHAGPIHVASWKDGADLIISVADQGPGVPARELERLFDPFFRLDESRASDTGGTGLGLAIVKTCVEACRGTVTASNRNPSGLEVQLRFPDQRVAGSDTGSDISVSIKPTVGKS